MVLRAAWVPRRWELRSFSALEQSELPTQLSKTPVSSLWPMIAVPTRF
jgi:hypothetical protein